MKVASFVICSLFLVGCLSTPGMKEPEIVKCTILGDEADCTNLTTGEDFTVLTSALLGFSCVSPSHDVKVANHHDALHTALNQCKKRK